MWDNFRDYLKRFLSKPHIDARATAGGISYAYRFQGRIGDSITTMPVTFDFELDLN